MGYVAATPQGSRKRFADPPPGVLRKRTDVQAPRPNEFPPAAKKPKAAGGGAGRAGGAGGGASRRRDVGPSPISPLPNDAPGRLSRKSPFDDVFGAESSRPGPPPPRRLLPSSRPGPPPPRRAPALVDRRAATDALPQVPVEVELLHTGSPGFRGEVFPRSASNNRGIALKPNIESGYYFVANNPKDTAQQLKRQLATGRPQNPPGWLAFIGANVFAKLKDSSGASFDIPKGVKVYRVFRPKDEESARNAACYVDQRLRDINANQSPAQKFLPAHLPLNFKGDQNPTPTQASMNSQMLYGTRPGVGAPTKDGIGFNAFSRAVTDEVLAEPKHAALRKTLDSPPTVSALACFDSRALGCFRFDLCAVTRRPGTHWPSTQITLSRRRSSYRQSGAKSY